MANDNDHHIIHNTQNEWKATGIFFAFAYAITLLIQLFSVCTFSKNAWS